MGIDGLGRVGTPTQLKGIRRAAARQMIRAWEAPAFHLTASVDMSSVLAAAAQAGAGITVTDVLIQRVARALSAAPEVNTFFVEEQIVPALDVNIGLAVATDTGLLVPVIRNADALTLAATSDQRRDIVQRAKDRSLRADELAGGTFTISNLGMFGIQQFDAILNVPQVAILAVGATTSLPEQDEDGGLKWSRRANFTLTCDHRALDGASGARFLQSLKSILEGGDDAAAA